MSEPWHKNKRETSLNFGFFSKFLAMGPERTLTKLSAETGKGISLLRKWSAEFAWMDRAAAYDAHMQAVAVRAAERARTEMTERQMQLGQYLQGVARAGLRRFLDENGKLLPNVRLSPRDCARLIEAGVKIERLARGETTENTKQEHTGEVRVLRFPERAKSREEWIARFTRQDADETGSEDDA